MWAVVIKAHHESDAQQLDLEVGDVVRVLEKHQSGWWGGQKEGTDCTGWFPGMVVRLLPKDSPKVLEIRGGRSPVAGDTGRNRSEEGVAAVTNNVGIDTSTSFDSGYKEEVDNEIACAFGGDETSGGCVGEDNDCMTAGVAERGQETVERTVPSRQEESQSPAVSASVDTATTVTSVDSPLKPCSNSNGTAGKTLVADACGAANDATNDHDLGCSVTASCVSPCVVSAEGCLVGGSSNCASPTRIAGTASFTSIAPSASIGSFVSFGGQGNAGGCAADSSSGVRAPERGDSTGVSGGYAGGRSKADESSAGRDVPVKAVDVGSAESRCTPNHDVRQDSFAKPVIKALVATPVRRRSPSTSRPIAQVSGSDGLGQKHLSNPIAIRPLSRVISCGEKRNGESLACGSVSVPSIVKARPLSATRMAPPLRAGRPGFRDDGCGTSYNTPRIGGAVQRAASAGISRIPSAPLSTSTICSSPLPSANGVVPTEMQPARVLSSTAFPRRRQLEAGARGATRPPTADEPRLPPVAPSPERFEPNSPMSPYAGRAQPSPSVHGLSPMISPSFAGSPRQFSHLPLSSPARVRGTERVIVHASSTPGSPEKILVPTSTPTRSFDPVCASPPTSTPFTTGRTASYVPNNTTGRTASYVPNNNGIGSGNSCVVGGGVASGAVMGNYNRNSPGERSPVAFKNSPDPAALDSVMNKLMDVLGELPTCVREEKREYSELKRSQHHWQYIAQAEAARASELALRLRVESQRADEAERRITNSEAEAFLAIMNRERLAARNAERAAESAVESEQAVLARCACLEAETCELREALARSERSNIKASSSINSSFAVSVAKKGVAAPIRTASTTNHGVLSSWQPENDDCAARRCLFGSTTNSTVRQPCPTPPTQSAPCLSPSAPPPSPTPQRYARAAAGGSNPQVVNPSRSGAVTNEAEDTEKERLWVVETPTTASPGNNPRVSSLPSAEVLPPSAMVVTAENLFANDTESQEMPMSGSVREKVGMYEQRCKSTSTAGRDRGTGSSCSAGSVASSLGGMTAVTSVHTNCAYDASVIGAQQTGRGGVLGTSSSGRLWGVSNCRSFD
eukprot:TRINITY_DN6010_c0_g1_i1.p1 TRINITY_DN6010_c0_g1~~TRINITY_DN6010_c0_g1_i1.p1  ORF type:complete len:1084 (+),score=136.81 TRINITY_DN6010_c0_g1_i1:173-3424(+)